MLHPDPIHLDKTNSALASALLTCSALWCLCLIEPRFGIIGTDYVSDAGQQASPLFRYLARLLFQYPLGCILNRLHMHLSPDEVVAFFEP
jgi:hypothetical protein